MANSLSMKGFWVVSQCVHALKEEAALRQSLLPGGVHLVAALIVVVGVAAIAATSRAWASGEGQYAPYYDYETIQLTTAEFFAALNYDLPGLQKVQQAVAAADYARAAEELKAYLAENKADVQQTFGIRPLRATPSSIRLPDAERILTRYYTRGNVSHQFTGDIDWLYNPTAQENYRGDYDKEWTAWLTRFPQLATLTDAYRLTANPAYAREAIYLMKHFIQTLPVPAKKSESGELYNDMYLSYNELSTAVRAGAWVRGLLSLVDSPLLTAEDLVLLLKGLYEHLLRIERYEAATPNWKAVQVGAMIEASVAFPEFRNASRWIEWSVQELAKEFDRQVYPDGAQIELDPGYHQMVMNWFLKSLELMKAGSLPIPADLLERLAGMARFIVSLSRPDGSLPAFGDASQNRSQGARANVQAVAELVGDEGELLWYGTSGERGRPPAYASRALEWSGYYVMRTGWSEDDLYMAIKAGPYGAAHQNDDKLSFELYAHGQPFLIDPGMYIYDSANPWRKYFVSSLAHNTVVVDGYSQYRRDERESWVATEPNAARWVSEPGYDYFSGVYNSGYADFMRYPAASPGAKLRIAHQRDILFVKTPGFWLIVDWMTPADEREHTYEALFQSLLPVERSDEGFVVGYPSGAVTLGIYPLAGPGARLETEVVMGQMEPVRRGWIYSASRRLEPLPTAVVRQVAAGSTAQAYLVYPQKGRQPDVRVRPLELEGPDVIGAQIEVDGDLAVTFIAQKQPGRQIAAAGLQTTGRMKAIVRAAEKEDVIEIPFDEAADLPSIYDEAGRIEAPGAQVLQDVETLGLTLLYSTDFEEVPVGQLPEGWMLVDQPRSPDAPRVVEAPEEVASAATGARTLFVGRTKDTSTETKYAAIVIPPAKERVRVSFDMYTTSAPRSLRVTLGGSSRPPSSVHPGSANTAIFLAAWNGELRALVGKPAQQWVHAGSYTPKQWHRVTLDIDVAGKRYWVYMDGDPFAQNADPIPFYSAEYDDINTVAFAYQSISTQNNTDPVYIDNVEIWGR